MSRSTIHDVARAAGVSIKTVSRVLNNEPNVRLETREKIVIAMRALNYAPSPSARSLAGSRSWSIGLVYDNPSANYVVDLQYGAIERCRESRWHLWFEPVALRGELLAREVTTVLAKTRMDGLIVTPPLSGEPALLTLLEEAKLPYVRISPPDHALDAPYVEMDDEAAALEMTRHLIAEGHRQIAFIEGHPEHHSSALRRRGFEAAMREAGLPIAQGCLEPGRYDFESGVDAARRLLARRPWPTAIFACNDDMAAGVITTAHELGFEVPGDVSIAGFDDTYIARTTWPRLTTIHQPTRELAWRATDLLLQQLQSGEAPRGVKLAHRLVKRESTAPPKR